MAKGTIKVGDEVAITATVRKRVTEDRVSVLIPSYDQPHSIVDTTPHISSGQKIELVGEVMRVDEDTVLYQFTVEDAGMWAKPWSGELPMTRLQGQIYEYACHEANYGLANTLSGARATEAEAAKKAAAERK